MKIIGIFVKNLTSGGAEKQAVLLARVLASDVKVHFIVFNGVKVHEKYLIRLKEDNRISVCLLKGGRVSKFQQLVKYLRVNHIDMIFSYLAAANLYACIAGKLAGVKVYTGLRNVDLPWKKRFVDKLLANHIATRTIVNCHTGKANFVKHGFREDKLIVIPNGFDDIHAYYARPQADMVKIITVGRFHPQKDYDTAIAAFDALHNVCENTKYMIVGYGSEEQSIRAHVRERGIDNVCEIIINPDNIPELLDEADIYLSTSLIEGTSNSIMEAMNASLPIVATDVGDNAYLVENGSNGFLLPVKDVNGIANRLAMLAKDAHLRQSMGKKSLNILKCKYSVEEFRNNYLKIIGSES